jgi:predicted Fe-Mo cluster-binding NifX family protein
MKIAVASDDEITIAQHFGRTKGFVIVELENGSITNREYRENNFTSHGRGPKNYEPEPGRHGPILEALKDCDVIISHGMGKRLLSDLKVAVIEICCTEEMYVARAINYYAAGILDNNLELVCDHN